MLFEEIKPCLTLLPQQEALDFFTQYYNSREIDLATPPKPYRKKSAGRKTAAKRKDQIKVTADEMQLLKKMGLI